MEAAEDSLTPNALDFDQPHPTPSTPFTTPPRQLALKYYQGLVKAPLKRTDHQWGFKPKPGGGAG